MNLDGVILSTREFFFRSIASFLLYRSFDMSVSFYLFLSFISSSWNSYFCSSNAPSKIDSEKTRTARASNESHDVFPKIHTLDDDDVLFSWYFFSLQPSSTMPHTMWMMPNDLLTHDKVYHYNIQVNFA